MKINNLVFKIIQFERFSRVCIKNKLTINIDKCKYIPLSKSLQLCMYCYKMSIVLENVNVLRDL